MRRPLIPVALLYVAGILLADLPVPLAPLFAIAFTVAFAALFWAKARGVLLCALLVMVGWLNLAHRTAILSPSDLRAQMGGNEAIVTLRGVLCETPYHRVHEIKKSDVWSTTGRMDALAMRPDNGKWLPAFGRVVCHTPEYLPDDYFAGQTLEISGILRPARGPVAEGLFDYRSFLEHQGVYYELDAKEIADWHIVSSPPQPPLADRFCAWARKTLAMGLPSEDETLRLEWALTLGWKAALSDETAEPFIKAATYHIFAVDGLRIAIICGILIWILRAARIPRPLCGILITPALLFYAGMTGWPASAIRAIVMITIIFGGWLLRRPSDLINSLFAAALVILLWEPRQLFQAGFQLSFFVVLCILLILPGFNSLGERLLQSDPLRPAALQPLWQRILLKPARFFLDLFLASVAAWLGSIPLVAWYFHLLTPMSGPANLLAVPLCALVLICNFASLFFAAWLPFASVLLNQLGWHFMDWIRVTSNWSAHWPGAYFYVSMPSLFTITLYYLILLSTLTGWLFKSHRRILKISGLSALTVVWCAFELWQFPVTRLTVLPFNGGHAVYLKPPGGWNDWLIDCGNESSVENVTKLFLEAHGVNRLSNFVLTHGEIGFIGGAQSILDTFPPRNIYLSPIHFRSPDYRAFAAHEKDFPAMRTPIKSGDRTGPWTVLYPQNQTTLTKADDNALVLRGEFNGTRVLLLSDLSHAGQNALLNLGEDLRADIAIAGLPSDGEPLSDALLDAVRPRVIIVADSLQPANKKAGTKLKERLERRGIPALYTSQSEAVTIATRNGHWELSAMDGTKFSGLTSSK